MSEAAVDPKTPAAAGADPVSTPTPDQSSTPAAQPAGGEAPPAGSTPSLLGDTPDDGVKVEVKADWPEDWRAKMAGGDERIAKRLERFSSPDKVTQSWLAAEQKISSGEYKKGLDENATEEQIAEWRKSNGIPEDPKDYKLPDTVEWTDTDRELFGQLFEQMHGANASQAQVDAVVSAYTQIVENARIEQAEADKIHLQQNEDALRTALGEEYRAQMNLYKRVFEDTEGPIPKSISEQLFNARLEDGTRLVNNAEFAQFVIELGLNHYGDGALITGEQKAVMSNRMEEIQQIMRTDYDRYKREGLDKEYSVLLEKKIGREARHPSYYDN